MRDLIQGGGLVMLSQYGLVKVLRVEAYMQGTIRLMGVGEWWYPLPWWPCHWVSIQSVPGTQWVPCIGHAAPGLWKGWSWWCRYGAYCQWCQRSLGKALFNAIMSQTWAVEQEEVTLGDCALRGSQGQSTRIDFNVIAMLLDGGLLHCEPWCR